MKKKIVILSGAGISAESGLKTFRNSDGLWEGYDINEVATYDAWLKNPALVLEFYNMRRKAVLEAKPNKAHFSLVELEKKFAVTVITQNVDDLHERAGSKNVVHLHGEILQSKSSKDDSLIYECRNDLKIGDKCERGYQLRPNIVWFGEAVPMIEKAAQITSGADIFIVVGTSLVVYPAAGLINYAKFGIPKYCIDPNKPDVFHIGNMEFITAKATEGVPVVVEKLIKKN